VGCEDFEKRMEQRRVYWVQSGENESYLADSGSLAHLRYGELPFNLDPITQTYPSQFAPTLCLVEIFKSFSSHSQAFVICSNFSVSSEPPSPPTLVAPACITRRCTLPWFICSSIAPSLRSRRARFNEPVLDKIRCNNVVCATSKSRPYPSQEVIEVCGDETCGLVHRCRRTSHDQGDEEKSKG